MNAPATTVLIPKPGAASTGNPAPQAPESLIGAALGASGASGAGGAGAAAGKGAAVDNEAAVGNGGSAMAQSQARAATESPLRRPGLTGDAVLADAGREAPDPAADRGAAVERDAGLLDGAPTAAGGGQCFRGRSVEELIPQIERSLGADAIVVGRRSGLEGGIAGFFQRPFIEIEAVAGQPGIDVLDDEPALPEHASRAANAVRLQPDPDECGSFTGAGFATELQRADAALGANSAGGVASGAQADGQQTADGATEPAAEHRAQAALARELAERGIGGQLTQELIAGALCGVLPLGGRCSLRRAVRSALQARIPQLPVLTGPATMVVVGPGGSGKTSCLSALAARYADVAAMPVQKIRLLFAAEDGELLVQIGEDGSELLPAAAKRALSALGAARSGSLCLIDTPPLSVATRQQIKTLARLLSKIDAERVMIALPATLAPVPAAQLLDAMAPLHANALAITHADESDQPGMAIQAAIDFALAPELQLRSGGGAVSLSRVDSFELAERVLP